MFNPETHVWMRRTTDGNGPHPIHRDEVRNYRDGEWVECDPTEGFVDTQAAKAKAEADAAAKPAKK